MLTLTVFLWLEFVVLLYFGLRHFTIIRKRSCVLIAAAMFAVMTAITLYIHRA